MTASEITVCRFRAVLVFAMALSGAGSAAAAPDGVAAAPSRLFELDLAMLQDEDAADKWRFDFTAWIWAMGIEGDIGAFGITKAVDASFIDILDSTNSVVGLSGRLEVGKGKFGGYIDGSVSKLGVDDVTVNSPDINPNANIDFNIDLGNGPFNPNPNPDPNPDLALGLLPTKVDVTAELAVVDFGLTCQIASWPMGDANAEHQRRLTLDAYAGARYTDVAIEIDPINSSPRERNRDWMDPIIGTKIGVPFGGNWELLVWGDIGGFGAASDLTWSATGVIGYQFPLFGLPAKVYAGYRAMGWDYSDGSGRNQFTWDATLSGPILGFSLKF